MRKQLIASLIGASLLLPMPLLAAGEAISGEVKKQPINIIAISMFVAFVLATLGLTYWAARRTRSASDFYTAGGGITGFQNGLAIAGDYMSAAAFLGVSGMVFGKGVDGIFYTVGWTVGWPLILFMIAERLRNLGRFTFADIAAYRLDPGKIRTFAAVGSLSVVIFYLIAQMVGAGKLIQLLFGLEYMHAVVLVGILMILYVTFGGMLATTWVQIVKAVLLLTGCTILVILSLSHFGWSPEKLMTSALENHKSGEKILKLSSSINNPINAISLALALMFGPAGLPHILMRFFTVPDAKAARKSVFFATGFIGYFFILAVLIGFSAITIVGTNPEFLDAKGGILGGGNMAAIHLSKAVGGNLFMGFISAVAFATILAVVSGLALAGASAVSHDIYNHVIRHDKASEAEEMKVSKIATIILGLLAVVLALAFEKQNIAFMVGLAFGLAASVNFPILMMSLFWKGLTTRGALFGGSLGLISAVTFVILGPAVWVNVLGNAKPIFPFEQYALFSMSIAFGGIWLFSITDKSKRAEIDHAGYRDQLIRSETSLGAAAASKH